MNCMKLSLAVAIYWGDEAVILCCRCRAMLNTLGARRCNERVESERVWHNTGVDSRPGQSIQEIDGFRRSGLSELARSAGSRRGAAGALHSICLLAHQYGIIWCSDLDFSLHAFRMRIEYFFMKPVEEQKIKEGLSIWFERRNVI